MLNDLLAQPLGYLIRLAYSLCRNYTAAIALFTLLTKGELYLCKRYSDHEGGAGD